MFVGMHILGESEKLVPFEGQLLSKFEGNNMCHT